MPNFFPDGRIVANDLVGNKLIEKLQGDSDVRQAAAKDLVQTGDVYAFENAMRQRRKDRKVGDGDLHLLVSRAKDLGRLALQPLHAGLPSWCTPASTEDADEPSAGTVVIHYVRQLQWDDAETFVADLLKFRQSYPAEAPRMEVLMNEAKKRPGSIYLRYFGTTGATSAQERADDDQGRSGRFWSNFVGLLEKTPAVFVLQGIQDTCSGLAYRTRTDLQATERALVSSVWPLCGNSARGGYHHEPYLRPYGTVTGPVFDTPTDATAATINRINAEAKRHLLDSLDVWNDRVSTRISDECLTKTLAAAVVTELVCGGVSHVRLGKDVTREAFSGAPNTHYFDRHVGRGAYFSRLVTGSLQGQSRAVMGPFTDFWNFSLEHEEIGLALLYLCRLLDIWSPLVVVAESAKLSTLLALHAPSTITAMPEYGRVPDADTLITLDGDWEDQAISSWWSIQGEVVISQYAPGRYSILAMVGDGGKVKYDPAVEEQTTHLIALSNKAALVAIAESAAYARQHGRPSNDNLPAFQAMLAAIRGKIKDMGLEDELDAARSELHNAQHWIQSRRQVSAYRRLDSTLSIKFAGLRYSSEREAQFDELLAEDTERQRRRVTGKIFRNLFRPMHCDTVERWRAYHLAQPAGLSIIRSTAAAGSRGSARNLSVSWDTRCWQVQRKPRPRYDTWSEVYPDPTVRVLEQVSEGSGYYNGVEVVQCNWCHDLVLPKADKDAWSSSWDHICQDRLDAASAGSTVASASRFNTTRTRIFFATDLLWYPELREVRATMEEHNLLVLIGDINTEEEFEDLAPLIPPGINVETLPELNTLPVLVPPGSSRRWIAINALALAHDLTAPSHPELEHSRTLDTQGLKHFVKDVSVMLSTDYNIGVLQCQHSDCDYIRLNTKSWSRKQHDCLVEGNNVTVPIEQTCTLNSVHDAPSDVRKRLLASLFAHENKLGVTKRIFRWRGIGDAPPKASKKPFRREAFRSKGVDARGPPSAASKRKTPPPGTASSAPGKRSRP